jgi:hypothetical protein
LSMLIRSQKKPVWLNYWPGSGGVSVDTNYPVKAFVADNPNPIVPSCFGCNSYRPSNGSSCRVSVTRLWALLPEAGSTGNGNSNSAVGRKPLLLLQQRCPSVVVGIVDDEANSDYTVAGIPLNVRLNAHSQL